MKIRYLIIIILSVLLAESCNKSSQEKPVIGETAKTNQNTPDYPVQQDKDKVGQSVNNRINTDYNTSVVALNIPGNPIDPNKLKDIIPAKIPGAQRAPYSTGAMMGDNGKQFTSAACNYTFDKGGLVINIQDYGKYENLTAQDKKYFSKMPTESGYETETVVTNEGKGFILWDSKLRNGRMYYLLANRFIIKLEAYTLPDKSGDIIYYFNMINQEALIKTANGN